MAVVFDYSCSKFTLIRSVLVWQGPLGGLGVQSLARFTMWGFVPPNWPNWSEIAPRGPKVAGENLGVVSPHLLDAIFRAILVIFSQF